MRGTPPNFSGQKQRKDAQNASGTKASKKVKRVGPRSDTKAETANGDGENGEGSSKPKRVRTGCLTCRERHLKCDEAMPHCNNCKKSNRTCKRGVRLNFIDTWESKPPTYVTAWGTHDWNVEFQDESREIASEYQGGEERYRHLDRDKRRTVYPPPIDSATSFEFPHHQQQPQAPPMGQILPPVQALIPDQYAEQNVHQQTMFEPQPVMKQEMNSYQPQQPPHSAPPQQVQYAESNVSSLHARGGSVASFSNMETDLPDPESAKKEVLDSQEETFFMQVFVEEVGLWMDSMDPQKHFSRLLPFHSLSEPMLLNAFLACGARHLTLINSAYTEEKALHYYDTATRYLLKNLQNPNRDTVICATTAVILNVYEIMSERALQRMNHIAGARALIKECGWDARAQGIGSACFWLNVGLEVLSCLHFNWQVAWNPDDWGVDMDFSREIHNGREEVWTHRMLFIIAKVCNFRATAPRTPAGNSQDEQIRMQQRHEEWSRLKSMCDAWNEGVPRTMHPMAYLHPFQTNSKSAFPEVWLIKRATIVARLFYHTAMLLMAQTHPYYDVTHPEMATMQTTHSRTICGIVAHVKDRGVASVAIRSLHHAAECLTDRKEQEEVLQVFEKINKETGWRIGFVFKGLKEKWGWVEEPSPSQLPQTQMAQPQQQLQPRLSVQFPQQMPTQQQVNNGQRLSVQVGHAGLPFSQQQQQQSMQMSPHSMSGSPASQHGQPQHMSSNNNANTPTSMPNNMDNGLLNGNGYHTNQYQQSMAPPISAPQPTATPPKKGGFPVGIPNPLYAKADFNLPQHPYQNFYVAPSHSGQQGQGQQQQQWGAGLYGQGQGMGSQFQG
ncbi:unnamed protein product [Zymoseptoria tritici ST99CH_1A5]|uniref:Zn(2)-C6 fungal-type domain-containing protein n=1 Tax=Zymoseptoria tritici ST99CH_1A5 TaxID=1276529 RepID=A0A1Y6LSX7_ZYMTR|nr:unnamed protein product [Zymoseptoria tritici ST99CH_1A5]